MFKGSVVAITLSVSPDYQNKVRGTDDTTKTYFRNSKARRGARR
jgi:hypothetical protein